MTRCPEVDPDDDSKPCQKQLAVVRGVEQDYHGGGHMFATDEAWARLQSWHYDAGSLLAGLPTTGHPPEECPGAAECSTAFNNSISRRT